VAACGEGTAPASEQAEVLAAEADQLGAMVDTEFGVPAPPRRQQLRPPACWPT